MQTRRDCHPTVPFGVSHTKPRIHRYNMVVFFFPEVLHRQQVHFCICIHFCPESGKVPGFLMWSQAVVHSNMPALFFQKEGHFGLVTAGPVGEGVSVSGKVLCQKGFGAGSGCRGVGTGEQLIRWYTQYSGAQSAVSGIQMQGGRQGHILTGAASPVAFHRFWLWRPWL